MNLAARYNVVLDAAFGEATTKTAIEEPIGSPLPGVSDLQWTKFVQEMASSPHNAVSQSNALGMFEFTPRRLADMGIINKLKRGRLPSGRIGWTGAFVAPMTSAKFLSSPKVQYLVFSKSMLDYTNRVNKGEIEKPSDMSLAGALAILHRAGPSGLKTTMFPSTAERYEKVAEIF